MLTKLFDLVGRVDDGIAMKLREAYFARLPANEQLRLLSKIFFLKTVTDQEILMRAVLHDRRGRSAGYKEKLALERIVDQKTLIKIVESLCAETSLDPNLGCIALERIEDETFLICLAFDESARVELRGAAATRISKQEVFIELVSRARVTKGHGDEWLGAKALRGIVDQEFLSSIALDNSVCGSWREIAAERVLKQEVLIELASRAGVDGSQRIRQEKLGAICLKGIVDQEFLSRVALDNSAYDSWRKIATAKLTKQEVLIELVSRAGVDKLERSKHEELGRIALKGIVDQEFLSRVVLDSNASSSWRQIAMDGLNDQEQLCKALSQPTVIPILGTEGLRKIFNQEFLVRIVLDESGYLQWRKIAAEQITDQALLISVVERIHENGSLSGEQKLVGEQVGEIALKKIDNAAFLAKLVSDRSVCGLWRATAVSGIADETLVLALTSEDEVDEVRGEAVRRLVLIGHRDEAYFAEFAKQAGSVAVAALSGVNSEALLVDIALRGVNGSACSEAASRVRRRRSLLRIAKAARTIEGRGSAWRSYADIGLSRYFLHEKRSWIERLLFLFTRPEKLPWRDWIEASSFEDRSFDLMSERTAFWCALVSAHIKSRWKDVGGDDIRGYEYGYDSVAEWAVQRVKSKRLLRILATCAETKDVRDSAKKTLEGRQAR